MTSAELKAWRKRLGLTQVTAADAIGLTLKSYQGCEQGRPVSRQTAIITQYVERDRAAS